MKRRLYFVAAALLLQGCVAADRSVPPADMQIIPGVPPMQQQTRSDDCAGVALASLLAHAGIAASPADIDAVVYDQRLGGAILAELESFAAAVGAHPRSGRGSLPELRRLLGSGAPILVPIDLGSGLWRRPHYVVLFGRNEDSFLLHLRANLTVSMTAEEFERRWSTMGRLLLYLEQ